MLTYKEILAPTLALLALIATTPTQAEGDPLAAARAEVQAAYREAGGKPPAAAPVDRRAVASVGASVVPVPVAGLYNSAWLR